MGASHYQSNPACCLKHGTALLDNYLNPAVLGTFGCRVVTGDRVAVPVACGREIAAHPAIPQGLSGTLGTSVRELLVGWVLLPQRTLDRHVVGVSRHVVLFLQEVFEDAA